MGYHPYLVRCSYDTGRSGSHNHSLGMDYRHNQAKLASVPKEKGWIWPSIDIQHPAGCNNCGELLDMCNLWCLFYVLSRKRTYWRSYPLQQINLGSDTHLERCGDDDHSHSAFCIALEVDHEYHKKNVCKIPKKAWPQVKFNRIGTSIILLSV